MMREIRFSLPPAVLTLIERFDLAGVDVFCVGGCVRDLLRGITPHDFDLCTPARPSEIKALFSDVPVIETGIRHGTVTVLWDGSPYEITTYRVDGTYQNHRRPDAVTFTDSLSEDCRRRDFTINAMAYHPKRGLYDFFGGAEDLRTHTIRCVGDPDARFTEDALRILRALRFSACFDFEMEEQTAAALHRGAPLLAYVSGERILAEWKKLLSGKRVPGLLLEFRDVIAAAVPFVSALSDDAALTSLCHATADIDARMAGILYLCGIRLEDDAMRAVMTLPADRAFSVRVSRLCRGLGEAPPDTLFASRLMAASYGDDSMRILSLHAALCPQDAAACRDAAALCAGVLARGDAVRREQLSVSGSDLALCGFRGREIGEMLDLLLLCVMRGTLPNEREALLLYASQRHT